MGWLGLNFNILSSTMPIIVTVSSLGILTHLLVRMGEAAAKSLAERMHFLMELVKEISTTVLLTGISTAVGFACLIPSDVQVISDYGLSVAVGVIVSSIRRCCWYRRFMFGHRGRFRATSCTNQTIRLFHRSLRKVHCTWYGGPHFGFCIHGSQLELDGETL